ncbi:SDR family NAD(P)-dependent oxidoreductase [Bisgaard Taxon 10/6]|uniref:SDR family NAD(P)-dependent oxidoreductase n=1 Tax=Exercitatus varius TaxID=67857 RepID=UPI00294AF317|nr:SDR family NAD(P)-dependent oxidoreductase [Exercitatus varius]MDG2916778.1 SDR family NAD(P)-dependent oxidoreductase [Exercitatus varius]
MTTQTQKWLITGASGGLGLMLAKQVLANGHQLVATTRNPSSMADLLAQYPNQLTTEALDISNIDDIKAFASKHQAFDVIVNNAGGAIIGAMEEMSDADIEQQLSLNLLAPIHLTRAFLPAMRAQKSGTLVYVTSIGGRTSFAGGSMYHTAKFGLEGFAETLAQEIAEFGIRTLIIEPGSIKSNFLGNTRWTQKSEAYQGSMVHKMRDYIEQSGEESISGDPVLMANVIYGLTQEAHPPLRTALGVDAFAVLEGAYQKHLNELQAQKEVALSVAIAGKTGFTG